MTAEWQNHIPVWYHADVMLADRFFAQARAARLRGEWELAEELTDRAEAIYQRVENALPESDGKE